MNDIVKEIIAQYLPIVIQAIIAVISGAAVSYIKKKVKSEETRNIIATVVKATEQIHDEIHGREKLYSAENRAKRILESKGIILPDYELTTLIESAVHDMNVKLIDSCENKSDSYENKVDTCESKKDGGS